MQTKQIVIHDKGAPVALDPKPAPETVPAPAASVPPPPVVVEKKSADTK